MEQKLAEERAAKLRLENRILELEKHSSMMDCDYKQALQKLDELRRHKDRLTEEVRMIPLVDFKSKFTSAHTLLLSSGEEPDAEDRAGEPEAQPDSERPEGPEPAAQQPENLREAAETGNQSPAGHQTQLREAEPGAAQVCSALLSTCLTRFFYRLLMILSLFSPPENDKTQMDK